MDTKFGASLRPRKHLQGSSGWDALPQDIWNLIFRKLASRPIRLDTIASLRLVAPSWRDAVQQCPWELQCEFNGNRSLEGICKALPAMSSLLIQPNTSRLQPEFSQSGLPQWSAQYGQDLNERKRRLLDISVDLQNLPPLLQSLSLDSVYADPTSFAGVACPRLTYLNIIELENTGKEVAELMNHLPALRGLQGRQMKWTGERYLMDEIYSASLQSKFVYLTSLGLTGGDLRDTVDFKDPECVIALQDLRLCSMILHPDWLKTAFIPLQQLKSLDFDHCHMCYDSLEEHTLTPLKTLQSLRLHWSNLKLLGLAPDSLKSLSYSKKYIVQEVDPEVLGRMTGLTQLRLANEAVGTRKNCSPMSRLKLQELALIDCPNALSEILDSGACKDLRKLHFDTIYEPWHAWGPEYVPTFYSDESSSLLHDQELSASYARRLDSLLRSLPHLEELSGKGWLHRDGMSDFLEGWHEILPDCHDLTVFNEDGNRIKPVWRKP